MLNPTVCNKHRAVAELKKMAGKQFDPKVVEALFAFIGDDGREIDRILAEEFPDSFIGLTLPSVDPAKTGKQYRAEAARLARLAGSEAGQ